MKIISGIYDNFWTQTKTTQERGSKDLEIISGFNDNFWTQNYLFISFFQAPVWRFDSKTLLQRFNVAGKDENGDTLYKSANLFSGYIASNRTRYVIIPELCFLWFEKKNILII